MKELKSLKKKTTVTKKINKKTPKIGENFKCFSCKEEKNVSDFYKTQSDVFEIMPICKECAIKLFVNFYKDFNSAHKAMFRMCALLDIYYEKNLVDGIIEYYNNGEEEFEVHKIFTEYVRRTNSLKYLKGLTFYNSEDNKTIIETKPDVTTSEDNISKWGVGYSEDDYKRLNQIFIQWSNGTPLDTITQKSLTYNLCKIDLLIEKETIAGRGNSVDKLIKQKLDLIKSLGITPSELMKYEQENKSTVTFSDFISTIEEVEPADFINNKELYKDVDGFEKYFNIHFIRSIKNLLLGHRDFPNINIDENDNVEFIDEVLERD